MPPELRPKLKIIFAKASKMEDAAERHAYLEACCEGQQDLREEVESLLACHTDQPFLGVHSSLEGKRILQYEFLERLGEGGMGIVYKARDVRLDRLVAIKVLPAWIMADPESKHRFALEAMSASKLNHPNVVTVYGLERENDVDFMVMEFVPGRSLDQLIPSDGMGVKEAIQYARQIAVAVTELHTAGVVHGDLKPANIMVTPAGQIKILDFGLAARLPACDSEHPNAGGRNGVMGTPNYLAPERTLGLAANFRSDLFSFGVILYEMLTGRRPFACPSPKEAIDAVRHQAPPPLPSRVPKDLQRLVERCLEKEPHRRYPSAQSLLSALNDLPGIKSGEQPQKPLGDTVKPQARVNSRRCRPHQKSILAVLLARAGRAATRTRKKPQLSLVLILLFVLPCVYWIGFRAEWGSAVLRNSGSTALAASPNPESDDPTYDRAVQLMRARRYPEAVTLFGEFLHRYRGDLPALYNRAVCLQNLGRPEEAITDFSEVIRHVSSHADALYNRAMCYMALDRAREALDDLSAVIRILPSRDAFRNRSKVRALLGDDTGAAEDERGASNFDRRAGGRPDH